MKQKILIASLVTIAAVSIGGFYELNLMQIQKPALFFACILDQCLPFVVSLDFDAASLGRSLAIQSHMRPDIIVEYLIDTLLKSEVEVARQHVDSNTDINIAFDSVCNSGDNQASAQYYQDTNINGIRLHITYP